LPALGAVASCWAECYWLRNWTATENYYWKQQGLLPVAPFPYKPFKDRRIDLSLLPYPHEFTQEDLPDYLDVLMGFFLFARNLSPTMRFGCRRRAK
jgi:hypothetical protein